MKRLLAVSECVGLLVLARCAQAQSPPGLSVQVSNGSVWLEITGDVGSACAIQYCASLSQTNNWQLLTNLTLLSSSPYLILDTSPATASCFYRAFSQQVTTNFAPTNMVWIPPGTFVMGSPTNEALRSSDETQHTVTLTKGFYMGKYAVTQGEYLALIGSNPSYFTPDNGYSEDLNRPVEEVSWFDATNYCAQLTQQEQAAGRLPTGWVYRLPTESEWEYACRAGTTTAFNFGSAIHGGMANFNDVWEYDAGVGDIIVPNPVVPVLGQTTTVGSYQPNAWGLYDMHGNVWEWCRDWYGDYPTGSVSDPQGPDSGPSLVMRGGGWINHGSYCRSAQRLGSDASTQVQNGGFRIVLAPSGVYNVQLGLSGNPLFRGTAAAPDAGRSWNLLLGYDPVTDGTNQTWQGLVDSQGNGSGFGFTMKYGVGLGADQGFENEYWEGFTGPDWLLNTYYYYTSDVTNPPTTFKFTGLDTNAMYDLYFYGYKSDPGGLVGLPASVTIGNSTLTSDSWITTNLDGSLAQVALTAGGQYDVTNKGHVWNVFTNVKPNANKEIVGTLNQTTDILTNLVTGGLIGLQLVTIPAPPSENSRKAFRTVRDARKVARDRP